MDASTSLETRLPVGARCVRASARPPLDCARRTPRNA